MYVCIQATTCKHMHGPQFQILPHEPANRFFTDQFGSKWYFYTFADAQQQVYPGTIGHNYIDWRYLFLQTGFIQEHESSEASHG